MIRMEICKVKVILANTNMVKNSANYINKFPKFNRNNKLKPIMQNSTLVQNIKYFFKIKNNTYKLPVVSVPILEFMATTKKTMATLNANKAEEQASRVKLDNVTWEEKQSRKILKNNGISKKSEQNKLLDSDGSINKKGQSISHKGAPEDTHFEPQTMDDNMQNEPTGFWDSIKNKYQEVQSKFKKILGINDETVVETTTLSDVKADIQLQQDLDWVNSINEKMCPECEEIYNAIPTEIPDGLMSNIMGDIPEGFMGDKDLLKMLKDMTKDFLGEQ